MIKFQELVYNFVRTIPKGQVATYGEVACRIGKPQAMRAVGSALGKNRDFANVPCHRVVQSNGKVGYYVLGIPKKIKKLQSEGVEVIDGQIDLGIFGFEVI